MFVLFMMQGSISQQLQDIQARLEGGWDTNVPHGACLQNPPMPLAN